MGGWGWGAGKESPFMLFLKTKKAKPPSMNRPPPKQAAKDIFIVTEQLFGLEQLWPQIWLLRIEHKLQPCPGQWLGLPGTLGPFAVLVTSQLLQSCRLTVRTSLCLACTPSPSSQSCFSSYQAFTSHQNFVFGGSASSKSCLH